MRFLSFTLMFFLGAALVACSGDKTEDKPSTAEETSSTESQSTKTEEATTPIYELAINQAKEGQYDEFLASREAFVEVLGKEENTLNEGKWAPFFTVGDMKLDNILVGMTHWNGMEGFGESAAKLMPQEEAQNYFATFNPIAYALLETVDGKPFDMESIKEDGNVVEFAIRKGTTDNAFGEPRDTFFKSLENYDGFKFAREFKVYELDENSQPNFLEGTQAVIIVWDNMEDFQAGANPILASKEYEAFSKNLEVSAYFATLPTE